MDEPTRPMTWDELAHENTKQKKEIERLRKEKEWLIFKLAKRMYLSNKYQGKRTAIVNHECAIKREMQQALKEE